MFERLVAFYSLFFNILLKEVFFLSINKKKYGFFAVHFKLRYFLLYLIFFLNLIFKVIYFAFHT